MRDEILTSQINSQAREQRAIKRSFTMTRTSRPKPRRAQLERRRSN